MSEDLKTKQAELTLQRFYLRLLMTKRAVHQELDPYVEQWRFSGLHPGGTYIAMREMCRVMQETLTHYLGEEYVKLVNEFGDKLQANAPDADLLPLVKRMIEVEDRRTGDYRGMFPRPVV